MLGSAPAVLSPSELPAPLKETCLCPGGEWPALLGKPAGASLCHWGLSPSNSGMKYSISKPIWPQILNNFLQSALSEIKLILYFDFQSLIPASLLPSFSILVLNSREVLCVGYPTALIINANLERSLKTGETNKLDNDNREERSELLMNFSLS